MEEKYTFMLQGTASGVGKSTLCAGLCRVFTRRGYDTAPFKAMNLSDNAHILPDGRRMARSQAIAAYACNKEPAADMNPILVMPKETGYETVLWGETVTPPDRTWLKEKSVEAYRRLAQTCQLVIAEGAGSPVELNLMEGDVSNTGFASRVKCPVILVADIRRGGMFAAVYGTLELMQPEIRSLVKGIIVNDFYGDPSTFGEGVRILEEITHLPVLGVVPHTELFLEDEDSLAGKNMQTISSISSVVPKNTTYDAFQLQQLDLLADTLEKHLDIEKIEAIFKEG